MHRVLCFLFLIVSLAASQEQPLSGQLPLDSTLQKGVLDNGLTYYIRHNEEPRDRAELRLVVKAGSILEEESQRGLAHFLEHMAFNGTKNFQKQELVSFLESIGMRFGPDINAYTSFDETVYMLQVPTDSLEILQTAFQVLEDWAHNISLDPEEIDKERGVVIEEWRLRRGAGARLRDKQFPVLFHNSRYAERLPIGKKEILESFDYQTLRDFYETWYRPELMAVVAVGDFDEAQIREFIIKHFSNIKSRPQAPERTSYPVPGHDSTLYSIESDPEARFSSVSVYKKIGLQEQQTHAAYRRGIVEQLYFGMLNNRLNELTQKPEPPYLYASTGKSRFNLKRGFVTMNVVVRDNGLESGFEALLAETERVRQHGFTAQEFEREKKSIMRSLEQALREMDKRKSGSYAAEYIRNFLEDEPVPGLPYEYDMYERFMPGIGLDGVNALADKWISGDSRVVLVAVPEKEGLQLPEKETLQNIMQKVSGQSFAAYSDELPEGPLAQTPQNPGKVVKTEQVEEIGLTIWTLENGVRVYLKPTNFKNDQILFSASSHGGLSLISTDSLVSAQAADALVSQSGLGPFNNIQLQKYLSDKVAGVRPYISRLSEGFSGSASPQDLETLLQMVYVYFNGVDIDTTTFAAFMERVRGIYENRAADPGSAFQDTLNTVMTQNHPRFGNWNLKTLDKIDRQQAQRVFNQRFDDGDDFTFFIVGSLEPDSIRGLVEMWLGSLPVQPSSEKWLDKTYDYPDGMIRKNVHKGLEEKSRVSLNFTGTIEWSMQNRMTASWLEDVLRIKLREELREDRGGTYGVGVSVDLAHFPKERYRLQISFGSEPLRTNELVDAVFRVADSISQLGPDKETMDKVREIKRRDHETNLRENGYWLNQLEFAWFHGIDPAFVTEIPQRLEEVTAEEVQQMAQKMISREKYVRVDLYPQELPGSTEAR